MDQWNQRMNFPPHYSPNLSYQQQNIYRANNPQQNSQSFHNVGNAAHFLAYQQQMTSSPRMNHMDFNTRATSHQPLVSAMTPAELENLKKKRNFEEQQKRLMALKTTKKQSNTALNSANQLNDLFGKKENVGMASLLGSLGDVPKPKGNSLYSVQPTIPQTLTRFPATQNKSIMSSNVMPDIVNSQRATHFNSPNEFQEFHSSASPTDDFGDFQQSLVEATTTVQSSIVGPMVLNDKNRLVHNNIKTKPANGQGLSHALGPNLNDESLSTANIATIQAQEKHINSKAPPALSIDDLMEKSLSLDNRNSIPTKGFEKLKVSKVIKGQASHFTESAKASKFEDLDSLSEMFTIPQAPLTNLSAETHVLDSTSDEWSDFSGVIERSEKNETSNQLLGNNNSESILPNAQVEKHSFGQVMQPSNMPTSFLSKNKENIATNSQQDVEGDMGSYSQQLIAPSLQWQSMSTAGESIQQLLTSVKKIDSDDFHSGGGNSETVIQEEEKSVDPEHVLYGCSLPEWSKDSRMLPAVYKQVHKMCSSSINNVISTSQLYPILLSSGLPRDKLSHIWSVCNKASPGELFEIELYLILGMIALAQVGLQINKITLEKLSSCATAPIPSFPERIFQDDSVDVPSNSTNFADLETPEIKKKDETNDLYDTLTAKTTMVDAVKHPDWSRWKSSKASQIDDKFSDLFKSHDAATMHKNLPESSGDQFFGDFQSTAIQGAVQPFTNSRSNNEEMKKTSGFSMLGIQPIVPSDDDFGEMTGASESVFQTTAQQLNGKSLNRTTHVMSAPLPMKHRYNLNEDEENVDSHEKAWLKCLLSCFDVIKKSYETLANIYDDGLLKEIFSSKQGVQHFTAIIEIYCVSQRVKATVLKSASNNLQLKQTLQDIENIWKTYKSRELFAQLLPIESFNFSGCHMTKNDDASLSCGICLLNVNKACVISTKKTHHLEKLSYGSKNYHTTCANFWCNKVDSVLPSLQPKDGLI